MCSTGFGIASSQQSFLTNALTPLTPNFRTLHPITALKPTTVYCTSQQQSPTPSRNENKLAKLAFAALAAGVLTLGSVHDASAAKTGGRIGGQSFKSSAPRSAPRINNNSRVNHKPFGETDNTVDLLTASGSKPPNLFEIPPPWTAATAVFPAFFRPNRRAFGESVTTIVFLAMSATKPMSWLLLRRLSSVHRRAPPWERSEIQICAAVFWFGASSVAGAWLWILSIQEVNWVSTSPPSGVSMIEDSSNVMARA